MFRFWVLWVFPVLLWGQGGADLPLVMYAEGEVELTRTDGNGTERLYTGNYLARAGHIRLADGARLEVASRDRHVTLDGPHRVRVQDLFTKEAAPRSFFGRFFEFVRRGLEDSASSEDLERAYERNQGNARGNISGYGDAGLAGLLPFGGTLYRAPTTFRWPAEPGANAYRLRVVDSLTEAVLLAVTSSDTTFALDIPHIQFRDGHTYYWEVFANTVPSGTPTRLGVQAPAVAGTRIYFGYRDLTPTELLLSLSELPTYRETASEAQRRLMEAMVYEETGYLYGADRAYHDGLAHEPGNELIRRTYAAFLSRWHLRSAAQNLLKQP